MSRTTTNPVALTPTKQHIEDLFEKMYEGKSLREFCRDHKLHAPTMSKMILCDPVLSAQYARAKETRGEYYGEKVIDVTVSVINGDIKPEAGRVAMEGYKWASARMSRDHSDKIEITHGGLIKTEEVTDPRVMAQKVAFLLAAQMAAAEKTED